MNALSEDQSTESLSGPKVTARQNSWGFVSPLFLSAAFYLTTLFALLAPLPLLLSYFRRGRTWALFGSLVNAVLVAWLAGPTSLLIYSVTVLGISWVLGESLNKKFSLEKAAFLALLSTVLLGFLVGAVLIRVYHIDLLQQFHTQIMAVSKEWIEKSGQPLVSDSKLFSVTDFNEWKQSLWVELFPSVGVMLVLMIWVNLVLVVKANPGKIRERLVLAPAFLSHWKAPELLVWPTIVSGFFLIWDYGLTTDVSRVVFNALMAIYAIQGLSILSAVFDLWGIRGWLRVIGYSISLGLMIPLVLILGFFDLWFDFRGKFRQS